METRNYKVQVTLCLISKDSLEKDLEHTWQQCFLIISCVCRWDLRFDLSANAREHLLQVKGFSPVWVLIWPCSSHWRENDLSQTGHLHGKVCVFTCIFKAPIDLYALPQYSQSWSFFNFICVVFSTLVSRLRFKAAFVGLMSIFMGIFSFSCQNLHGLTRKSNGSSEGKNFFKQRNVIWKLYETYQKIYKSRKEDFF